MFCGPGEYKEDRSNAEDVKGGEGRGWLGDKGGDRGYSDMYGREGSEDERTKECPLWTRACRPQSWCRAVNEVDKQKNWKEASEARSRHTCGYSHNVRGWKHPRRHQEPSELSRLVPLQSAALHLGALRRGITQLSSTHNQNPAQTTFHDKHRTRTITTRPARNQPN